MNNFVHFIHPYMNPLPHRHSSQETEKKLRGTRNPKAQIIFEQDTFFVTRHGIIKDIVIESGGLLRQFVWSQTYLERCQTFYNGVFSENSRFAS